MKTFLKPRKLYTCRYKLIKLKKTFAGKKKTLLLQLKLRKNGIKNNLR